jgi:hypothetical protein
MISPFSKPKHNFRLGLSSVMPAVTVTGVLGVWLYVVGSETGHARAVRAVLGARG